MVMSYESAPSSAAVEQSPAPGRFWHNWDWVSIGSFAAASVFGAIGVANNVRHTFWNNFIQGFHEIETPFAPIRDKFQALFRSTAAKYKAGDLKADVYRTTMRDIAEDYRQEIATKLLKDFNIPTNGLPGWTVGTYKRMKELGLNGRISTTLGFATLTATAIGAVSVLRNSKHTIDRVEDKIDHEASRAR